MTSARWLPLVYTLTCFSLFFAGVAPSPAQEGIDWVAGPATVDVGADLAQFELPAGYRFADADDTRKLMELFGNPPTDQEVGLVAPAASGSDEESWFLVFEYSPVGYVRDDEKDEIDDDDILSSIREGTEASNEQRKKMGAEALHIVGWFEKPHYDERSHNLVWAIEAKGDDPTHRVVNHEARLLGRRGYVAATLVTAPDQLAATLPEVERLMGGFSFKQGHRYAEFVQGDKVAEYGLAALVAGGAGAAALKLGLFAKLAKFLAKGWKLVAVGFVSLAAAIRRWLGGRSRSEETPAAS